MPPHATERRTVASWWHARAPAACFCDKRERTVAWWNVERPYHWTDKTTQYCSRRRNWTEIVSQY